MRAVALCDSHSSIRRAGGSPAVVNTVLVVNTVPVAYIVGDIALLVP